MCGSLMWLARLMVIYLCVLLDLLLPSACVVVMSAIAHVDSRCHLVDADTHHRLSVDHMVLMVGLVGLIALIWFAAGRRRTHPTWPTATACTSTTRGTTRSRGG